MTSSVPISHELSSGLVVKTRDHPEIVSLNRYKAICRWKARKKVGCALGAERCTFTYLKSVLANHLYFSPASTQYTSSSSKLFCMGMQVYGKIKWYFHIFVSGFLFLWVTGWILTEKQHKCLQNYFKKKVHLYPSIDVLLIKKKMNPALTSLIEFSFPVGSFFIT